MDIFEKLGIDSTLFIQMTLFLIVYGILHPLVLKPLMNAYQERETLTLSDPDDKQQKLKMIKDIKEAYELKLRKIHVQIQNIFSKTKNEANNQVIAKMTSARDHIKKMVTETQQKRNLAQAEARKHSREQLPKLVHTAVEKILGRKADK